MDEADRESLERLAAPLNRLAELGHPRPPSLSLERYLGALVSEGRLGEETVKAYLPLHQELLYGRGRVEGAAIAAAASALEQEIKALTGAPVPDRRDRKTPAVPHASGPVPQSADEPVAEPASRLPGTRRSRLVAAVVLWTAAMLVVGYLTKEPVDAIVADARARFKERTRPHRHSKSRLERASERLREDPADLGKWKTYAESAYRAQRFSEAIAAYEHLVRRKPGDTEALNSLAWIYCTAADELYRDPARGLELAEQAFALDRSPHITDTLAEAAFVNGDVTRAVALELDALSRIKGNRGFYEKQLARFRAAAEGVPAAD